MKNKGLRAIGKALIVVLALITIAFGFQVTKVNLAETKSPTRQTQLTRILRALAKPDIFTRDTTDLIVELPVVIPCGAEQPAPADTSKPYLVMEPACAEPRATVTVKGYNLPPNAKGPLAFVPPSNVTLGLANIETDANGYFEAQVKLPNRPDTTVQTIRLTTRTPSGAPKFSRSAIETWDKIVETIFLALLATIIGTLFAVPVSFLAARNLMEKVNSPLISVALNLILIPLGAFLGIRLAALLKGLLTLPAANWVIALPGLIVVLAAAFFILTKGMPAVDKEKAKYIKRAFEMYSTGEYPLAQIRKIINSLGLVGKKGKMLSVSNYQYMLKNKIYYGMIEYNGELYDGKHEPIITKKLFDSVQEVMANKSKPKSPKLKPYIFRGFFRCGECGCFITTETQKGHNYLRCTKRKNPCSQRYAREDAITSQIKEEIKKVSLSSSWANASINYFENEKMKIAQAESSFAQKARDELVEIETKLDRLLDLQLDGNLSQAEYTAKKHKLILAKKDLEEKISAFGRKSNNRFELAIAFLKDANQAEKYAQQENPERIRDFLKKIGSNFRIADRTLVLDFKNAFKIAEKYHAEALCAEAVSYDFTKSENWRRGRDSNPGTGFTQLTH